jgi:voltage-gated potassium channel
MATPRPGGALPSPRRLGAQAAAVVLGLTVDYYLLPDRRAVSIPVFLTLFGGGLVLTAGLVTWSVRRYRRCWGAPLVRVVTLAASLYLAVLLFAASYLLLERNRPGEFVGLHTHTDALYFTLSVVSTVGFGDVHAAGQLARALVSLQMVFNLGYLGVALSLVRSVGRPGPQKHRLTAR